MQGMYKGRVGFDKEYVEVCFEHVESEVSMRHESGAVDWANGHIDVCSRDKSELEKKVENHCS